MMNSIRRSKAEIMDGINCIKSRKIANNTVEYTKKNGDTIIRLHLTDILTFKKNGAVILNSGGWQTVTTKERINRYLPENWGLYQEKSIWYLCQGYKGPRYTYQDGITLTKDKKGDYVNVLNAGVDDRKLKALDKKIKKYVDDFIKELIAGNIPAPSNGDCLYCCMKDGDGATWGDLSDRKNHILSHMKEKYYVPSLLWNMTEEFGLSMACKHTIGHYMNMHDHGPFLTGDNFLNQQIKKGLTRYIRRRLGMSA